MRSSSFLGLLLSIAVSNVAVNAERLLEGGYLAEPNQFKYQVSLQLLEDDCTRHLCGGAILDEWHVITAAHCLMIVSIKNDDLFDDNKNYVVVAGTTDLSNKTSGLYHAVDYIYEPKETKDVSPSHDLAILKLRRPLPLGHDPRVSAIELPTVDQYSASSRQEPFTILSSGFNFHKRYADGTVAIENVSPILHWEYRELEQEDFFPAPVFCNDEEVCTNDLYHPNGMETTCNADIGAPLVEKKTTDRYTLIGIAKPHRLHKCVMSRKFARVSAHLDFIGNVRNRVLNDVRSEKLPDHRDEEQMRLYPQCDY